MDHSLREKKRDARSRTVTLEFEFSLPGAEPFGTANLKLEGLVAGTAVLRDLEGVPTMTWSTSTWYSLPKLPASVLDSRRALHDALDKMDVEAEIARLSGSLAAKRGDNDIADLVEASIDEKNVSPCPSEDEATNGWPVQQDLLEKENEKGKNADPRTVTRYKNAVLYYRSCMNYHEAQEVHSQLDSRTSTVAQSFDLVVTIKEFRKRPFAEFFGAVLGDKSVQAGVTKGIVETIDPGSREAEREKAEAAALAAREQFEGAYVAALAAIEKYKQVSESDPGRPSAYIETESKKRAANRRARAAGRPLPFPESGAWL